LQRENTLETIFDWVTVGIFSGLIVLFLQRSTEEEPRDSMWQYLCAGVGCAVSNYLGNEGQVVFSVLLIGATLAFIWYFLKPLEGLNKE
jgi:hypothetical protein